MPATEQGTPSPRGALSKLRRNKGPTNASTSSLANGSGDGEDSSEGGGLRASMDAAFEKVKERTRRKSVDDRRGSDDASARRLSSIIPHRKRASKVDAPGLQRNLSAQSGDNLSFTGNRSESSLLDDSGHSSLLTDDNSDVEGKPTRPTLSPHQSHAGLLTLSSPELSTQTRPVVSANETSAPAEDTATFDRSASIPHIIEPSDTDSPPAPVLPNSSASPRGKLRGAFTLPRKQVSGGDTESVKSNGSSAGGLGGLFRPKSRRNSLESQVPDQTTKVDAPVADPDVSVPEPDKSQPQLEKSEERPQTPQQRRRGRINTDSLPATPPNLVDTPTTLVTPPTPTDSNADASTFPKRPVTSAPSASPPTNRPLSSVESIRHRRAQSANLPSKLSNAIPAPLTPTVEEAKTPGGTLTQPTTANGFFSSFFSAAQKAADQLSNNVNTGAGVQNKTKASVARPAQEQDAEVIPGLGSRAGTADGEKRLSAVETLGKGDLSLSSFGIAEHDDVSPMNSAVDLRQQGPSAQNGPTNQRAEEEAAARAVSVAYEKPVQDVVRQATGRPLSIASQDHLTLTGDQTPDRSGTDAEALKRSGSVRSKISGRRRRHRTSSATTGTVNTIAAAIQSSTAALANPGINGAGHRLTGFAVASSKRNKDFHQLFRSVPEDDYLIEDYSAALQRDILLHGRLYVSEGHICFSSNILGWVTNLVISFDEVVCVEKKSTAMIFPNAIVIQTLQARNTFASFVARDSTYELLIGIWKISHPNLKSSLNGVTLDDAGTGDRTEVADPDGSDHETAEGSDDEVYDEDDDDDVGSFTDAGMAPSVAGSEIGDITLSRKTSAVPITGAPQTNGAVPKGLEGADAIVTGAGVSSDFPGSPTHAPTECGEAGEHYDRPLTDTTVPAPLGKIYSLMFGPASNAFMRKWLVEDQKSRELNLAEDKFGLDNEHKTFTFDYIKPLSAPVGPRQTKCITTVTLVAFDLEKAVSIDCSTQTPDVPSGSVFTTKTRYCLMWGPENTTRIIANCTVEWTGKSWLKGPIEKGANDGQTEYVKAIVAALKAAVTTKPPVKGVARKGKRKGKKEVFDAEAANAERASVVATEQKPASWGILEPLHQILEPILAIFRPFVTSQVIITVLFVLLAYNWFAAPRPGSGVGLRDYISPGRLAAYEEIWRREESELWDWLEDRVGLNHLHAPSLGREDQDRQRALNARSMGKKLDHERMSERQMDDAIKVTEERLAALKDAVGGKKAKKRLKEV